MTFYCNRSQSRIDTAKMVGYNISEAVQDRDVVNYDTQLIGTDMWPIELRHFR